MAIQQLLAAYGGAPAVDPTALAIYNKIVAWWDHSGTGSAELLDSHTGGYDLSNPFGTYTAGQAAIAAGLSTCIETSVALNLVVAHATPLDLNNDFSIMCCFQRNAVTQPTFPKLIAKYTDAPNGKATYYMGLLTSTNQFIFRFNSGGSYFDATSANGSIADSTPYMAIATKLATGSELYLNNSLAGSQASGGTPDTATDYVRDGASSSSGNDSMLGKKAPHALFTPALTSTERTYLYAGGAMMSYATLKTAAGH